MSNPLLELRRLLRTQAPGRGVVTRVKGRSVSVATPQGLVQAVASAAELRVGQAVTIKDGTAYPAAAARERYAL